MNLADIELSSLNLNFEYEKICRIIDKLEDLEQIKNYSKYFMKLYFFQQETISKIGKM